VQEADEQQQERNVRQRQRTDSSSHTVAQLEALQKAVESALQSIQQADGSAVQDAAASPPEHMPQPTCCTAAQQELQQLQQLQVCVVCMDAPRSVLLLPCKHLALCQGCCEEMQQPAQRRGRSAARQRTAIECPVCRQPAPEQVAGIILA
jgi:hypothetical protein